jgi:phosphoglycolate phosphatase
MKAIIFDFDGVIQDTLDAGYQTNKKIHPDMSLEDYKDIFNGNLYTHKRVTPDIYNLFFESIKKHYEEFIMEEHVREELSKLKEKYLLFVITSGSEANLDLYMNNNSAKHFFKQILGFETHTSKVEKFKMILDKYNLTKDDCIFVTDTLGDLLEANKIGIKAIAVDYGFHERARLEKGNPIKIVSHFTEILPAIEEITK